MVAQRGIPSSLILFVTVKVSLFYDKMQMVVNPNKQPIHSSMEAREVGRKSFLKTKLCRGGPRWIFCSSSFLRPAEIKKEGQRRRRMRHPRKIRKSVRSNI